MGTKNWIPQDNLQLYKARRKLLLADGTFRNLSIDTSFIMVTFQVVQIWVRKYTTSWIKIFTVPQKLSLLLQQIGPQEDFHQQSLKANHFHQ